VESLLAANSGAGDFLVEPAVAWRDEPASPAGRDLLGAGAKLGPYTVIQKIDEGGMAVVYQAVRDDGEFRKLVAVKVLKPGMDTHFVLERFQNEKQILAHFDHPNIAKLLDSGSTPGGRPYFVLEFIAGQPIDTYCAENNLSIEDRLKLFQRICSAVEYAHQNLIVHRDLKPRNILVTASGDPRLLDFGIAKILSDDRELTRTGVRPMTPEYASPEQIRGEPVTTATDIYGLGVVLYELLTGCRPFRSPTGSMHELARMITEGAPRRPSTQAEADAHHWARRLRGDLDNIVLKAMHADPQRRYRSVGELAADIDRYFAGAPVLAAGDEWAYRAGKFVRRHRGGVIAGSLAFLSLAAGLAVATHEATVARRERAVSERHAAQVRRLANSLIFDLHDAIVNLPGATPVRAKLMGRATEALDSLRSGAGGNVAIQHELAAAYERLAGVQGGPQEFNLGELANSLKNYQNALALLEQVRKSSPGDLNAARSMAGIEWMISTIFERQGDVKGAASMAQKALDLREILARAEPRKEQAKRDLAMAYYLRGNTAVTAGDLVTARAVRQKALALWESIAADEPGDPKAGYQIALAAKTLAAVEQVFHDYGSAARHLERAHAIDRERVRVDPRDASARLDVSFDLSELAGLALQTGDPAQAAKYYVEARKIREDLLAHDAGNERLQNRVAYIRSREGRVHLQLGHLKAARAAFVRALDIRQKIASDRTNISAQLDLAESQGDLGVWSCTAGDRQGGKALLRRALARMDEIDRRSPLNFETRQDVEETRRQLSACE
jgi:non-specific serine/threonine protein kinase/serine/threonine-protein kinase